MDRTKKGLFLMAFLAAAMGLAGAVPDPGAQEARPRLKYTVLYDNYAFN
jgi:ABC-type sugar transport system substrate-binding protein